MGVVEALAVCQCGHKKSVHHDELGCCSCECQTFVLPFMVRRDDKGLLTKVPLFTCVVCGEAFEERKKLEAHFAGYNFRKE